MLKFINIAVLLLCWNFVHGQDVTVAEAAKKDAVTEPATVVTPTVSTQPPETTPQQTVPVVATTTPALIETSTISSTAVPTTPTIETSTEQPVTIVTEKSTPTTTVTTSTTTIQKSTEALATTVTEQLTTTTVKNAPITTFTAPTARPKLSLLKNTNGLRPYEDGAVYEPQSETAQDYITDSVGSSDTDYRADSSNEINIVSHIIFFMCTFLMVW